VKNWQKTLVTSTARIRKVIETIGASEAQIALVADTKGRLLGTITDGDVRRGILKGVQMNDPAEKVMNRKPVTAPEAADSATVLEKMKRMMIHQIPLVNARGYLTGLQILDELLRIEDRDNWVVLMAGGLGKRLMPLTQNTPKPLLELGDRPILETILTNFIEEGFKRFFLAVHYRDDMIRNHFGDGSRWGVRIEYIKEEKQLGTAGALGLLPFRPTSPLIVMNADLLTKISFPQLLDFHRSSGAEATMGVREYDFQVPFGVVTTVKNRITAIDEKPIQRFFVNAGIYVLEPEAIKLIPKNSHLDMTALFDRMIAKKKPVSAFPIHEYWLDIGRMDDWRRAHSDFSRVFPDQVKRVQPHA
jgi:dTDP-glucose pyrophosphorylase